MEEDKFSSHHREVCNMSESLNSLKGPGLEGLELESVYMVVYIFSIRPEINQAQQRTTEAYQKYDA